MFFTSISFGQEDSGYVIQPYFGLAVAYPDSVGLLSIDRLPRNNPGRKPVGAILTINDKGRVKQIDYASDSASYFKPIEKELKKIRFNFNSGREIGFPQKIPVTIRYQSRGRDQFFGRLTFPIDYSLKADTVLLENYFELNGIVPPRVKSLRPVFHRSVKDTAVSKYPIEKVVVRLDAQGKMIDLVYPDIDGGIGDHYVHLALMDAEYRPAIINGVAMAIDLPLIFRLFGNLKYPVATTDQLALNANPDSANPRAVTARYFMAPIYNPADLSIPPLPRKHPYNYINSAPLGKKLMGDFRISIGIDSCGRVASISIPRTPSQKMEIVREAVELIRWYPALDSEGAPRRFLGQILLSFDGSSRIVYNAEWLSP